MFFNLLSPDPTSEQSAAHVGCWAKVETRKRRVKVEGRKGKDKERENKGGGGLRWRKVQKDGERIREAERKIG